MDRKVVQIAVDPRNGNLIALASDGSIWIKSDEWHRMKDLPKLAADPLPTGLICRGSYALGSACGRCQRCADERLRMQK